MLALGGMLLAPLVCAALKHRRGLDAGGNAGKCVTAHLLAISPTGVCISDRILVSLACFSAGYAKVCLAAARRLSVIRHRHTGPCTERSLAQLIVHRWILAGVGKGLLVARGVGSTFGARGSLEDGTP
jgi:hypothetical protein